MDGEPAAERVGLPLIEAFHYRYHKVMLRVAVEIARSGELGPLTGAEARFCVPIPQAPDEIRWRADQGGGALGDLGAYPAHALRSLIGEEPEVVSASAQRCRTAWTPRHAAATAVSRTTPGRHARNAR